MLYYSSPAKGGKKGSRTKASVQRVPSTEEQRCFEGKGVKVRKSKYKPVGTNSK